MQMKWRSYSVHSFLHLPFCVLSIPLPQSVHICLNVYFLIVSSLYKCLKRSVVKKKQHKMKFQECLVFVHWKYFKFRELSNGKWSIGKLMSMFFFTSVMMWLKFERYFKYSIKYLGASHCIWFIQHWRIWLNARINSYNLTDSLKLSNLQLTL